MTPNKRWRAKNSIKVSAHTKVNNAVRKGKLKKKPCEKCGCKENVHAHHEDYNLPLDVRWLCSTCHRIEHLPTNYVPKKIKPKKQPRQGCSKYQPCPKREALQDKAKELRSKGMTYQAIADLLETSKASVYKWIMNTPYL